MRVLYLRASLCGLRYKKIKLHLATLPLGANTLVYPLYTPVYTSTGIGGVSVSVRVRCVRTAETARTAMHSLKPLVI